MVSKGVAVDEYGRIARAGIHDAVVQRISYSLAERLDICLKDPRDTERWLSLTGLVKTGFKDVVDGMIVGNVFCWQLDSRNPASVVMTEAWRVLFGGNYVEADFTKLVADTTIRHSGAYLVFLDSSYGGSIAALCDRIEFE